MKKDNLVGVNLVGIEIKVKLHFHHLINIYKIVDICINVYNTFM
jgi:hypothetical protein